MTVVWTNGCFDIIHRGHVELFKYAKSLGHYLIVGIDSDEKIKQDKGSLRPVNNAGDRKFVLKSIRYIDEVVQFNDAEELNYLIKQANPDIMIIGSDWKNKEVVGREHTKELVFFDRIEGYSTTSILENCNE